MNINLNKIKRSRIYLAFIVLTFILYGNTINNEYSLDDNIVVDGNQRIEDGFKAIPSLFKSRYAIDKQQSYDYRPIVLISFAIEKQFFGNLPAFQTIEQKTKIDKLTQANVSHFINIILYIITCIFLFELLIQIFPKNYNILLPSLIIFLFLIHPLHTEVVTNIKSRDELLMFLFLILSLRFYLKYVHSNHIKYLLIAPIFFILSVLSKKSGVAIVGILPVIFYYKKFNYKKILISLGTFAIAWISIILFRKGMLTGQGVRNFNYFENPLFFEGDFFDRLAVGAYCFLHYLEMLIFPIHLSYYYGYNAIPMVTFSDWQVWLSLFIFIPLSIFGLIKLYQRKIEGLGIVLWLGVMLMFINIFMPMVGIVADRFSYMFSLGFCILIAFYLLKFFKISFENEKFNTKLPTQFIVVVLIIGTIYSGRTIARNPDWHDYFTLYTNDIKHLNESAKAHALLASALYSNVTLDIKKNPTNPEIKNNINLIIHHYQEAIRIDSTYITSLNNLGSAYINFKKEHQKGLNYCKKALMLDSNYLQASYNIASTYDLLNLPDSAFKYYINTIEINPEVLENYEVFNKFLIKNNMIDQGILNLNKIASKVIYPKYIYVNMGNLISYKGEGKYNEALDYFIKAFKYDNNDKALCNHILKISKQIGRNDIYNTFVNNCQ